MRNKKLKIIFLIIIVAGVAGFIFYKMASPKTDGEITKEIAPSTGTIETFISTTGSVLPKNRLEIKPPVNGRVEKLLVIEGQKVKTGDILAWMSSTERAALLDAARGQGDDKLKYWQEVYKGIPLVAPIDAEVIVATVQPGQTVTTASAVVVLSDKLIVRAQVDETDIGKISLGQKASVALEAYQDQKINASVDHVYYESKTVNNVTIYEVDLLPQETPPFFRSGMNATIDFLEKSKDNIMIIPSEAVHKEKDEAFVYLSAGVDKEPIKRLVKLGITDDKNYEVISGLSSSDKIIIKTKKFALPKSSTANSPFTPFGKRR
ncbi:MAG: efflux RND transporter periplasmic adaptor subunit [Candidatus Omnitrophota bacterium]